MSPQMCWKILVSILRYIGGYGKKPVVEFVNGYFDDFVF